MPDTKLSALPTGSAITNADLFYSVQGGIDVKQSASALGNFVENVVGISSAVSISAISSLPIPTNAAAVTLTDPLRGGLFIWNSSNLITQVTNDPGQGIYIAPTAAPTGASGAWVRQFAGRVNCAWWGFVGDATATIDPWGLGYVQLTSQAWAATSGGQVTFVTAFAHGVSVGQTFTISGSSPSGYNATFLAITGTTGSTLVAALVSNPGVSVTLGTVAGPIPGTGTDNTLPMIYFAQWMRGQTAAGIAIQAKLNPGTYLWNGVSPSVPAFGTFKQYACYARVGVGDLDWDMTGAVLQNTYNEFISGQNAAAKIPFPLDLFVEMAGFPIQTTTPGSTTFTFVNPGDVATSGIKTGMIVGLGSGDNQFQGPPPNTQQTEFVKVQAINGTTVTTVENIAYQHRQDYVDYTFNVGELAAGAARVWMFDPTGVNAWQSTHTFRGVTVNLNPGNTSFGKYASIGRAYVNTYDWTGVGFSETQGRYFTHVRPKFYTSGEIDKFIGSITYNDVQEGPLTIQSCSPNLLVVNGGTLRAINGYAKRAVITGAKINSTQPTTSSGVCDSARFIECEINNQSTTSLGIVTDDTDLLAIDGGLVAFTSVPGVFQVDLTSLGFSGLKWATPGGMYMNLQASTAWGNIFSNDQGTGMVLGSYWLVNTLGTSVSPGWNGGSGYVNGSYTNVPLTGGTGTGLTANITVSGGVVTACTPILGLGQIATLATPTGGSGYTNGTYTNIALTNVNGAGSGATANITVAGNVVTQVVIVNPGVGYFPGSTLAANNASIGGGTGFTVVINTISPGGCNYQPGGNIIATLNTLVGGSGYTNGTYNNVPLTGGTGSAATANITVSGNAVTAVTLVTKGALYSVGDTLAANDATLGGGTGFSIKVATLFNGTIPGDVLGVSNVNLGGSGSGFAVPVGQMFQYILTDLRYTSLPTWATGSIYRFHLNELTFVNCTGSDIVRSASAAEQAGYRYFEYRKYPFSGQLGSSLSLGIPVGCEPLEISVNVRQPHATSSATLTISFTSVINPANSASSFGFDAFPGIAATVQIGVAGLRTWTQTSALGVNPGAATLDKIQVGGVTQTYLPTNRLAGNTGSIIASASAQSGGGYAVGEIILKFSAGRVRIPIAKQFDDTGAITAPHEMVGLQGLAP